MPSLRHIPVSRLALALRDRLGITTLIETGTFTGTSTEWAAEHFERVVSLDRSATHLTTAHERCKRFHNTTFWVTDSRNLGDLAWFLSKNRVLFYLDAHSIGGQFGGEDDCPLLDELKIIMASPLDHAILIDDAHCFTSDPPAPGCPSFGDIHSLIGQRYALVSKHDLIVATPETATGALIDVIWQFMEGE